jgi:hypothetical protein
MLPNPARPGRRLPQPQGLNLAIDDFGTGYSSLGRLNQTWVHMLKVDRSFVREMSESEHARNLVASVVQLAQDPAKLRRLVIDLIDKERWMASTSTSRATRTRAFCNGMRGGGGSRGRRSSDLARISHGGSGHASAARVGPSKSRCLQRLS